MLRTARVERGLSQNNLAQRLNVSRYSVMAIERGDPKVAIGLAFEAASILGIPLLAEDLYDLKKLEGAFFKFNALLPKRVREKKKHDDDF